MRVRIGKLGPAGRAAGSRTGVSGEHSPAGLPTFADIRTCDQGGGYRRGGATGIRRTASRTVAYRSGSYHVPSCPRIDVIIFSPRTYSEQRTPDVQSTRLDVIRLSLLTGMFSPRQGERSPLLWRFGQAGEAWDPEATGRAIQPPAPARRKPHASDRDAGAARAARSATPIPRAEVSFSLTAHASSRLG